MQRKRCTKCGSNRQLKFFATPKARVCSFCKKARVRGASRAVRLDTLYGLTLEDYDALLQFQDGRCAICGGTRRYNLHVDHDHEVERETGDPRASVRGLLCKRCNKLLAMVRDNEELLRYAQAYLRTPPAPAVLSVSGHCQ